MKFEKSCGCITFNEKNEVLLIHSVNGHWGMPKGHMEPGETELETAIREVKEETNIDVVILDENKKYTETYSPFAGVMKEVVYFLARNKNNTAQPQLGEIIETKWIPLEQAIPIISYESSKEIMKQVKIELEEGKLC